MKQFLRLTKTDPADFENLMQETIAGLENYRADFNKALTAGDKTAFTALTDKIKMTAAVLRADKLQKMLARANQVLHEPDITKAEFELMAEQIDGVIGDLIQSLKNAK